MPHYSWWKKSYWGSTRKLRKRNITKFKDVIESYWSDVVKFQGIKCSNYDNFKFINTRNLFKLSLEYTQLSLDFNEILRLRAGYKYNTTIVFRGGRVSNSCPKFCPCCGRGDQSFIHWIFECSTFSLCRCKSWDFIDDFFILFANKIRNFINKYIYIFLLGGISALDELQFDTGERGHLSKQLLKSSQGSTISFIMGLAEYRTNTIPIINSSLELLFERFNKNTFITMSTDLVLICQKNNTIKSPVNPHQYTFTNSSEHRIYSK